MAGIAASRLTPGSLAEPAAPTGMAMTDGLLARTNAD
jgi:hypothetical protein